MNLGYRIERLVKGSSSVVYLSYPNINHRTPLCFAMVDDFRFLLAPDMQDMPPFFVLLPQGPARPLRAMCLTAGKAISAPSAQRLAKCRG